MRSWRRDRAFAAAFGCSLSVHAALIVADRLTPSWFATPIPPRRLEVVYHPETNQPLRWREEQRARVSLATAMPGGSLQSPRVRISLQPGLATGQPLTAPPAQAFPSAVDLTDLAAAAQGDPVRLAYFQAIREQIQRVANRPAWLATVSAGGLVYVTFVLAADGAAHEVRVVPERSTPSAALRQVAVAIVQAAAPFPAFPPSLPRPQQTVIVPMEFLLGSAVDSAARRPL
jgi:TonB family protein